MSRIWQIMEMDDQASNCLEFIERDFINPLNQFKGILKGIINDKEFLIDTELISLNEKKRPPLFAYQTTIAHAWNYIKNLNKFPVDIIFLDIKMHEYEDQLDRYNSLKDIKKQEENIFMEYKQTLNKYSTAFDTLDEISIHEFREMGGIVVFGKIMRIIRNIESIKKEYPDPFPIIVIQTASIKINTFSSFEYAFPDYVRVIDKGRDNIDNNHLFNFESTAQKNIYERYENIRNERIHQLVLSGNIDPLKLHECLIHIEKNFPLNLEIHNNIIKTPLNYNTNGWLFVTLFPWVCSELAKIQTYDDIKKITNPLWSYVSYSNWPKGLYNFFENVNTPIKLLTHPKQDYEGGLCKWGKRIEDLTQTAYDVKKCLLDSLPSFIKYTYEKDLIGINQYYLKPLYEILKILPETPESFNDMVATIYKCEKFFDKFCGDTCLGYCVCKLEDIKFQFRRMSRPYLNIKEILKNKDKKFSFMIDTEDKWNISSNLEQFEKLYFPWKSLESLIEQIFNKYKEQTKKIGKYKKVKINIKYNSKNNLLNLIIITPSNLFHLDSEMFDGKGLFDTALQSLNSWCKIYIASNGKERDVHMPEKIGTKNTNFFEGIRYTIGIPVVKKEIKDEGTLNR